ncbi:MAG: hypothetical protein NC337_00205 [Roseburia sp.]|nr:hypothetical protein [Roseburia sp.]
MTQNITEAIEEVNLIKKVIDRTQNDFSRIADFFAAVGVINAITYLLYAVMFQALSRMEQVGYSLWMIFRRLNYVAIVGYIVLFLIYRGKLKRRNNDLSLSLINIWGVLLIGGEAFRMLFSILNFEQRDVYFYQRTLTFVFPIIGCFVLGFIIQDSLIRWVTAAVVALYVVLAGTGLEICVGRLHGNNVNIGLDMLLTAAVMSVGMIALGIYLRGKGER